MMMENDLCTRKECERCLCTTCMHQGFDCDCTKIHKRAVNSCEDYDEMPGEQISLGELLT